MAQISLDSVIVVDFTFRDPAGELVDPVSFVGSIQEYSDGSYTEIDTFTPVRLIEGVYETQWLAANPGKFKIELTSTDPDKTYCRYFLIGDVEPDVCLGDFYVLSLIGELDPLFVDPEYIATLYSDINLVEAAEIIHRKSVELVHRVGDINPDNLTTIQHDFIVAATMCEISRIYGMVDAGLSGFQGNNSFTLGDLEVDKSNVGAGNFRNLANPGVASSWCELAGILKNMLAAKGNTFKAVLPGAHGVDYRAPSRQLKDYN